ncbi:MAG: M50 family metallopeptidase [Candidatus Daviesbacteria bacterium]|nr:M50 family metallopeptidase [Candidatus Daviesbacteria bacterium]
MLFSIIIFIITLLVLVLIHEFGHFLVAKKFGIKVEEFGFGIPPRIWGKKIGETVYSINWLPFGGFVRLLGEEADTKVSSHKHPGNKDFRAKSVGQRIAVVVAGVVMNLILAWILFYTVIIGGNFRVIYPVAEEAVYIAEVEQNFPAEKAGLKIGEKLISIDNQLVSSIDSARNFIKSKNGLPVTLTLTDTDGNHPRLVNITPKKLDNGDILIGVMFSPIPFREYTSTSEKVFSGITYSFDLIRLTLAGFGRLGSDLFYGNFGQVSKSVSGPVGMAAITNDILSVGAAAVLPYAWFVGIISLTLAIFNVLPIPALDGGRLLFLLIEAVTRKKVKEDIERLIHQIGFALLLALALLVTFSDIRKLLP